MFIGFLPLIVGGAIPYAFFDFSLDDDGLESKIFAVAAMSFLAIIVSGCSEIGKKYPNLRQKLESSDVGQLSLIFVGSFMLSLLSILFTILPIPIIMHILLTAFLVLCGLYFFMKILISE